MTDQEKIEFYDFMEKSIKEYLEKKATMKNVVESVVDLFKHQLDKE